MGGALWHVVCSFLLTDVRKKTVLILVNKGADPFYIYNGRCLLYYAVHSRNFGLLEALTGSTGTVRSYAYH